MILIRSNLDKSLDKRWRWSAGAIAVLFAMLMTSIHGARAEDAPVVGQSSAKQATTVDLRSAPARPSVPMPPGFNFNRPPPGAVAARGGPPLAPRPAAKAAPSGPGTALSLYFQTPSLNEGLFGGLPPDGDIATSQHFTVQINNFGVTIYNLDNGTLARQVSFATFFGDNTSFLFDPRIIYDPVWNRFVVLVDACNPCTPPASNASFFELAVSQTSDPTGGYFIYNRVGVGTGAGDFADFEQMGMDLNSIIFTFNDFLFPSGFDARTFAVAKAYLYNGFGFGVPVFGGSGCTVAPPYVLDNGGPSYTLVACANDNGIFLGPIFNSGLSNVSVTHWQAKVPVAAYSLPPNAPQPGVNYSLETGFNDFENRSAQIGNRIWNVHTINVSGFAAPRWYEFNTGANTLVNSAVWFASGTSSDWRPSIVVNGVGATGSNPTGETFGTWMSVDAAANKNLQLFAIGGSFDSAGGPLAGIAVGPASAQPLTNQTFMGRNRSGDYSYISLYPGPVGPCGANEFAILEGEVSLGTNWGTRLGIVKHC